MPDLTTRQTDILSFIRDEIKRGFPPSVREIGEAFDIASPNGVIAHLKALEAKGFILRDPKLARGIRLTSAGKGGGFPLLTFELIRKVWAE